MTLMDDSEIYRSVLFLRYLSVSFDVNHNSIMQNIFYG